MIEAATQLRSTNASVEYLRRQVPGCPCNEEMCGEVLQVVPNAVQNCLRDFGPEARREAFFLKIAKLLIYS